MRTLFHPSAIPALLFAASAHAMEIVAHRGASHDAPENTAAAFRLAWEQKADGIELDIHLTRDGRIAVIHDPTTKRTTGQDRRIAELTLPEIRALDAGSWKGPQWKSERIPQLGEVLAAMPRGKRVFIEIKCGPEILEELAKTLRGAPCEPGQLVIIGFAYETLVKAKALLPQVEVLWIVQAEKNSGGSKPPLDALIAKAKSAGLDGLDLGSGFPIDKEFTARVHAAKLKLGVWTVDSPDAALRFREAGVDYLTTNQPALLLRSK